MYFDNFEKNLSKSDSSASLPRNLIFVTKIKSFFIAEITRDHSKNPYIEETTLIQACVSRTQQTDGGV